jgi:hypothetical protein
MTMHKKHYLGPYIECHRRRESPNRHDVIGDELLEMHTQDNKTLFLAPNVYRDGAPPRRIPEGEWCSDLRNVDTVAEMEWLRTAFAAEIEKLENAYGNATIRWGLCQWYQ